MYVQACFQMLFAPILFCTVGVMILLGGLCVFAVFCYLKVEHVLCKMIRKDFPEHVADVSDISSF